MIASPRLLLPGVAATLVGLAIAWVDSRPAWDDTGITAVALVGAGAFFAAIGRGRPWLWALLVAVWVPVLELGGSSGTASLAAFVFAGVGALVGSAIARSTRADQPLPRRG